MSTFIIHYSLRAFDTCVSSEGSTAAAAAAGPPFGARASSLSGRTRKNQCKPRHLSAIYNSLVLDPLMT